MNVLFLSLQGINSINESGIYTDVLRRFVDNGHKLTIISPLEKRYKGSINTNKDNKVLILRPNIGNITNTPFVEKGVSSVIFQRQIISCIATNVKEKVDLFILATPPVNENRIVKYVEKKYGARVYLLLKDIWPASINDLKMPGGKITKGLVTLFFRHYEKSLYKAVDQIGCMSPANVDYIISHNHYLNREKVHLNPNSIEIKSIEKISPEEKNFIREKYNIPVGKVCFVYGGTLGVGQNVPHIIRCIEACKDIDCHFLIVGNGVQFDLLQNYQKQSRQKNLTLLSKLPKDEYIQLMQSCDIGLVFLRFTAQTPNFPSRILNYMEYSMPILACTDPITDINQIIEDGKFGFGCLSDDPNKFKETVVEACKSNLIQLGCNGKKYMEDNYSADDSYQIIIRWYDDINNKKFKY